ncbi:MAG TPA: hypothetical protein PLN06_02735 [Bacteroidales bacterium]|nr:hypothetical protein [Bacteroidales bacterium]HQG52288.1 hypothetical protein [Bacteroidales bacterium]HQJ19924.1 hypothetical protein [Bacteroidales bacterium]
MAKSTIALGQNSNMSATSAPTLICRAGCPEGGFVLWQLLTAPPNNVAHELNEAAIKMTAVICNNDFFILARFTT